MDNFDHNIENIEAYLEGRLSNEERQSIEEKVKNDEAFKSYVDDIKTVHSLVVLNELTNIEKKIREYDFKEKGFFEKNSRWLLGGGIGVVLTFFLITTVYRSKTTGNHEELKESLTEQVINYDDTNQVVSVEVRYENKDISEKPQRVKKIISTSRDDKRISLVINDTNEVKVSISSTNIIKDSSQVVKVDKTENKISTIVKETQCDFNVNEVQINIIPSCAESPTGRIDIKTNQILTYYLDDDLVSAEELINLSFDYYTLKMIDSNGCEWTVEKEVRLIQCATTEEYNDAYSKSLEEPWLIPYDDTKSVDASFKVYSQYGKEIYKKESIIKQGYSWIVDSSIEIGEYSFIIQYEDGRFFKGVISILP